MMDDFGFGQDAFGGQFNGGNANAMPPMPPGPPLQGPPLQGPPLQGPPMAGESRFYTVHNFVLFKEEGDLIFKRGKPEKTLFGGRPEGGYFIVTMVYTVI